MVNKNGLNGNSRLWLQIISVVIGVIIFGLISFYINGYSENREAIASLKSEQINVNKNIEEIKNNSKDIKKLITKIEINQKGISKDIEYIKKKMNGDN
jgi:Tfp pilus assembly protein PilN